jgi:hypothetical protein
VSALLKLVLPGVSDTEAAMTPVAARQVVHRPKTLPPQPSACPCPPKHNWATLASAHKTQTRRPNAQSSKRSGKRAAVIDSLRAVFGGLAIALVTSPQSMQLSQYNFL